MKKKDLAARVVSLEEELRKRGEGRIRKTAYFVLLNPNVKSSDMEDKEVMSLLSDIVKYLADNIDSVITFNKEGHSYSTEFIKKIKVRFALEKGSGRRKKDGTYPEGGGCVHAHVVIYIEHLSNITITYDSLVELLEPEFRASFGKAGFISRPRLIQADMTEDYMTKSLTYKHGFKWKTITK
jgi:hypothetical protein